MSDTPHYHGHRSRLRERFRKYGSRMEDYEILELLLTYALPRQDTKSLAKELLDRCGNLKGVLAADPHELRELPGFGPGLECFWAVWREFWARLEEQELTPRTRVDSPERVAEAARRRLGFEAVESLWAAMLDNKNRLIAFHELRQGSVDHVSIQPREVLSPALEYKASGLILVHNHPGGDPSPSGQDLELTRRVQNVAAELGIRVLDHLIVAEETHHSLRGEGLLPSVESP
ncbi:MAG: DNA repair protein RadC [Desulfohalobiaceae bacterium]|nr:DNA repair protein RadC [Desulfohalobiaceae bacterium]